MSREELLAMFDAGDLYGAFVRLGRAWLAKDHPEAQYAATAVHIGRGLPEIIIPVLTLHRDLGAASPPSPRPA